MIQFAKYDIGPVQILRISKLCKFSMEFAHRSLKARYECKTVVAKKKVDQQEKSTSR